MSKKKVTEMTVKLCRKKRVRKDGPGAKSAINRLYRLKMQPTAAERALFILVKKTPRVPVPLKSLYSAAI